MKVNQHDRILNHVKQYGSITSIEAYSALGITQLSARLKELSRAGYIVDASWEKGTNRYGEAVKYKRYHIF